MHFFSFLFRAEVSYSSSPDFNAFPFCFKPSTIIIFIISSPSPSALVLSILLFILVSVLLMLLLLLELSLLRPSPWLSVNHVTATTHDIIPFFLSKQRRYHHLLLFYIGSSSYHHHHRNTASAPPSPTLSFSITTIDSSSLVR